MGNGSVAVVSTGGTIASVRSSDADAVKVALTLQHLINSAGLRADEVGPTVELAQVNSWSVDPELMWQLAATVEELASREDIDGIVVTHGTDTLEESAFAVDILTTTTKPVVFTAAMRSADELSADGPRNFRDAVEVARSPAMRGLGALVCLDGQVQAARWARKSHTISVAAFSSPNPLGTIDPDGKVRRSNGDLRRWTVPGGSGGGPPRADDVPVMQAYTGMSASVVDAVTGATRPRGVVIDGFGLGHVPSSVLEPLEGLVGDGVLVVVATRVPVGGTWPVYGGPGGGMDLAARGVLTAGELSASKARLLLLACLSHGVKAPVANRLFQDGVSILGRGAEAP